MDRDELHRLTLWDLSRNIRSRALSPVEAAEGCLARIEEVGPKLNAFITVCAEDALAAARAAEAEIAAGRWRGPLHGVPFAAKDIFDTAGVRTTQGSSFFRDNVPAEDAASIRRLKEAGAILIGKANTHEFAAGSTTKNPHWGACRNPWDLSRVPGGSSGGSGAAVAAALVPAATGTDTGGSIRGPAAMCGVVGLKPTYGRVSLSGIFPNAPSLDHAGPLARTARDCGLLLQGMAGHEPDDPTSADVPVPDFCAEIEEGVRGMRLGLCPDLEFIEIDGAVRGAFEEAVEVLRGLGARTETHRFPLAANLQAARQEIADAELRAVHRERFAAHPEDFGEDLRERLERAGGATLDGYIRALREREIIRRAMEDLFAEADAVLLPGFPCAAAPVESTVATVNGKEKPFMGLGRALTGPHNLTGFPALSVPTGLSPEGLPLAMQIVGPPWEEGRILRIAHAYEEATPEIRSLRPPIG
ncbi:MAG: amidase [bacterium]